MSHFPLGPDLLQLGNVVSLAPRRAVAEAATNAAATEADRIENGQHEDDGPPVDLATVEGRALAINGALSTLEFIEITGKEYWFVFDNSPEADVYAGWIESAHRKISSIRAGIENTRNVTLYPELGEVRS